ncbi:MAG TPA: hypothetical protein PLE14_06730 [Anaerolineales bacterium]|nr:hypothetical protein [Anaerolineales bacterium]HNO30153.1 hypothetical protein [Anaerolineales bacterium]
MKRLFLLTLILLAACSSPQTPVLPATAPASLFDLTPAPLNLKPDATSEEIQRAMLESATHWTTLHLSGTTTWYYANGSTQVIQDQAWLDPLNSRFRSESISISEPNLNSLKISDGQNIYSIDRKNLQAQTFAFPDFARVGQYVPQLQPGVVNSSPLAGQIGSPLVSLVFASDFAQTPGTFKALALETVAGREALSVEWIYIEYLEPSLKLWIDTQTGIILKMLQLDKTGTGTLEGELVIESIAYDVPLGVSTFMLPAEYASIAPPPTLQVSTTPVATGAASMSAGEAGELYFFLQPRQQGQSIELVKVSGICVYDPAACPPLEKIAAPFPFNFTLNAMSWSKDGRYAAFSYSDAPNGTPTKLWLFDANAKTWTPLAEFPYIDPPFWSPDGTWIAFRTQDGLGGEDVFIVHPDGSELKSISADLSVEGRPYIMDGWYTENVIMRSALPGAAGNIFLVRAANGQARPMFETLLTKAQFIASPDAGFLAYDEYDYNSQAHQVKVMEPDGVNAVTVAQFAGGSIYPMIWSPDSSLIAFNYYRDLSNGMPSAEVYAVSRRGNGAPALVYQGNTVGRLLFSPNGRYLLVEETTSASGGHLFIIDLTTMSQAMLQAPGLSTDFDWYAPSWRP